MTLKVNETGRRLVLSALLQNTLFGSELKAADLETSVVTYLNEIY